MKQYEVFEAYDAIIALEASGNYRAACKRMRSINKCAKRRAKKWSN